MPLMEISGSGYSSKTKIKILEEATKLFALKGYGAVSMRDIGSKAGIKMSTIYYYYESKEALFEDIIARFEYGYKHFFEWLQSENAKAASLDELMDILFSKEAFEMIGPMGCLRISIAIKEQYNMLSARNNVFKMFIKHSVRCLKSDFDALIKKGIIPPNDTRTIASLLVNSAIVMNEMNIHRYISTKPPADSKKTYNDMKEFFSCILAQGLNEN